MKKILLLLVVLLSASKMSAIDVEGQWVTTMIDDEQSVAFTLSFNNGGKLEYRVVVDMKDPEIGSMTIRVEGDGTWALDRDKLTLTSDPKKSTLKLIGLKLSGEMGNQVKGNSEAEKMIRGMIEQQLKSSKTELLSDLPLNKVLNVVYQSGDKLTLQEGNSTDTQLEFTKI